MASKITSQTNVKRTPRPSLSAPCIRPSSIPEMPHPKCPPLLFKSPSNIDVCHPVALSHMARAINKYITSTTSLGNHSLESVSSASGTWETLESYISRIILACQVPNIVAYTSLYLLMTISRSCSCKCTEVPDDFLESPKPKPPPLSHQISQALSRSAISRVQKSHWVGHHFFMGPFLLVLRSYERISGRDVISHELLSFVSGLSANDLKDLESSIDRAMGTNIKLTIQEMIKQRDFRSLRETECPYITTRRMREARRTSLEKRRAELLDSTRRENERNKSLTTPNDNQDEMEDETEDESD